MPEIKKFLDQTGTGYLWGKIKQQLDLKAAAADLTALAGRVDSLEAGGYDDTALAARVTANETAIAGKASASDLTALDGKVTTLIGSDADKSVRTIANEELATQLIPQNAQASLDTLQEIADWIQAHPADVAAINSAITALQNKLELAVDPSTSAQYTTVKAYVEAAIAGLEAAQHTHSNKAVLDGIADTDITAWNSASTNSHTHSNKSVLDNISATDVSNWSAAEQNAKSYADGLANNYATSAQGAKADTALQASDIASGATNGTIAVKGTDVAVHGLGTAAYAASTAFDAAGAADAVYAAIQALSSSEIDSAIASASSSSGS